MPTSFASVQPTESASLNFQACPYALTAYGVTRKTTRKESLPHAVYRTLLLESVRSGFRPSVVDEASKAYSSLIVCFSSLLTRTCHSFICPSTSQSFTTHDHQRTALSTEKTAIPCTTTLYKSPVSLITHKTLSIRTTRRFDHLDTILAHCGFRSSAS